MAMKAMLFLLAFMLFVTTMDAQAKPPVHAPPPPYHHGKPHHYASSPEKHDHDHHHEHDHDHDHHEHHHGHAPKKSPEHPEKHHHPYAPLHPPSKAGGPVQSVAPKHGCTSMCAEYCKKDHLKKRPCMKDCTVCCNKSKCVPEPKMKCNWDYVMMDGKKIKCP